MILPGHNAVDLFGVFARLVSSATRMRITLQQERKWKDIDFDLKINVKLGYIEVTLCSRARSQPNI